MLRTRIIPCLLLKGSSLVKTVRFSKPTYIGDPINTCRIFNEMEVDELSFLDIRASLERRSPDFKLLKEIAGECFMPVSYGGGIDSIECAEKIFTAGFEKIVINSSSIENPQLISDIAGEFGSQSLIVSVDVRRGFWKQIYCCGLSGSVKTKLSPEKWAKECENLGAGEILLTSIDREGTWKGLDVELINKVSSALSIPLIAHGGAGSIDDIAEAVNVGGASAVALGSMVVYQKKDMGVLVNFPDRKKLQEALEDEKQCLESRTDASK